MPIMWRPKNNSLMILKKTYVSTWIARNSSISSLLGGDVLPFVMCWRFYNGMRLMRLMTMQ